MDKLNKKLGRRNFLARLGGAAVAYWFGSLVSRQGVTPAPAETLRMGSGRVTGPKGKSTPAGRRVKRVVRGDQPNGFTVPGGETWEIQGLVTTPKNAVVKGTLRMRAGATLRFRDVNESAFIGGGMDPLKTDVGLWVIENGKLDIQGSPKVAWNRTGSDASWFASDELVIAPVARNVTSFSSYKTGDPVPFILAPDGRRFFAEVLNLTRDVNIEGTPTGRSHVFIRSTQPQLIKHATFRHLGAEGKLGRYPLHFHHSRDGSRGSIVEGVLVRDSGNRGFVPHASHGITLKDCITYNTIDTPYFWDLPPSFPREDPVNDSHDSLWKGCVAALVTPFGEAGSRLAGFHLGAGERNVIRDCVAVGVLGSKDASGFFWPEAGHTGVWEFSNNIAHNNRRHGIFVWQNDGKFHFVDDFVGYQNGAFGIAHGAYGNNYRYRRPLCFDNFFPEGTNWGGFRVNATFSGVDQPNLDGVVIKEHRSQPTSPFRFRDGPVRWVRVEEKLTGTWILIDFIRCDPLEPANWKIVSIHPRSRFRVQRKDGTAYQVDATGIKTISAFA